MLINDASKKSKLTKKAIEYYTDQKLVFPSVLPNGYRDYSNDDLVILKKIALYRRLDLNISEIKAILYDSKSLNKIVANKVIELEESKIKTVILKKLCDGENLMDLEEEINDMNSKSIIINKLKDLFPGFYGNMISIYFSCYLNGTIETEEQMEAFVDIIEFLDNVPKLKIPLELQEYFDKLSNVLSDEKQIKSLIYTKEESINNIEDFINNNQEILSVYSDYKKSEEYKNSYAKKLMDFMKEFCSNSGYNDKFIPAMRKLSPKYNEYYEKLLYANEEFLINHPDYIE